MIRPEDIPEEVVEAAAMALYDDLRADIDPLDWTEIGDWRRAYFRKEARASIAAAIAAWPGMWHIKPIDFEGKIILPTPTENTNAEG